MENIYIIFKCIYLDIHYYKKNIEREKCEKEVSEYSNSVPLK